MAIKKCPTVVQMAWKHGKQLVENTVTITNGYNVVVAVALEMATNPVHISYRISYVFLL